MSFRCRTVSGLAVLLCALLLSAAQLNAQTAGSDTIKLGEFDTTFAERSPLSAKAAVLKRLGAKDDGGDYDLSKETYKVYVPKNYDSNVPHGVIYWLGYKETTVTPPRWQPIMDREHLIFVAAQGFSQPDWQRAGLALDAVHNLKKIYRIDPQRIYFFGFPQPPGTIPQQIGLAYPDAFNAFVYIAFIKATRQVPVPGGRFYPQTVVVPPGPMLGMSKTRKHVFVFDPINTPAAGQPDTFQLFTNVYEQDGFKNILRVKLADHEDAHYANLSEPWFEQILTFLNKPIPGSANGPASAPATVAEAAKPSTAPAPRVTASPAASQPASPSEAQRALNLTRTYITAGSYTIARQRLQNLIAQYPKDPAATEAKKLLDEIKNR